MFRSLYSDHEPTSYISILKLLSRHAHERQSSRQDKAIEELRDLRKLKARALLAGSLTIAPSGRELTPEVLIDVFLHGRYLHKDDNKMSLLEDLRGDVFLMFEFMGSVQRLSRVFVIGRAIVQPVLDTLDLLPLSDDRLSE